MQNLANHGVVEGRLAADPTIFNNKDGSRKVSVTLFVRDNFSRKDGSRGSQRIQLERFIPKGSDLGIYSLLKQGAKVAFGFHLESDTYESNGRTQYVQKAIIDVAEFRETRAEAQQREANKAAGAAAAQATPANQSTDDDVSTIFEDID